MKRLVLSLAIVACIACDSVQASSSQDTLFRPDPLPHVNPSAPAGIDARVMKYQWDAGALPKRADLDTWQQPATRAGTDRVQTPLRDQPRKVTPRSLARIPDYPCYRTVEETYADLSQLATAHPNLASWVDIGNSWDKVTTGGPTGYDLFALVLTNEAKPGPKFKFFLMAAIHARELATAELATRFAEKLVADYGVDPDVTWLLDNGEVHIVPIVNPDGRKLAEQAQPSWRKNTDNNDGCTTVPNYGTDLNRNSSFHWGGGSTSACDIEYQGPSAASEPETQAIQNYVASILPDQRGPLDNDPAPADTTGVFVTLHSYGQQVLFPYAFRSTAAPNNTQLETLGRKFGYLNGYTVCQIGETNCKYLTTGTTDDWTYGTLGVAAYTIELGTAFAESCSTFESTILSPNLAVLSYAFKAARRPYQSPAGPDSLQVTVTKSLVVAGTPVTLTAVGDDTRYYSNGWGSEPVQTISAARYTVDAPSWITGVVSYTMTPTDGVFNGYTETVRAAINTSGWAGGRHLLLVESRDAWGNWGVPSAVFLRIAEQYGVILSPAVAAAQAYPGKTASYTFQLTNAGNIPETFDISAGGNVWTTSISSSIGPLAPVSSAGLTVTVNVPSSAVGGASDTIVITATSRMSSTQVATATLVTTAAYNALAITPTASLRYGDPGAQVVHTLRVTNTGNITDTFDVTVTGNTWTTSAASAVGPVAAGVGANLNVTVTVPSAALAGANDAARIRLTSRGDPSQSVSAALTTTANTAYRVAVGPSAATRWGDPDTAVTYTLRVTNTGNITDTFDVTVTGNAWATGAAYTVGPLAVGGNANLSVTVTVPSAALAGAKDAARITLTSQGNPSRSAAAVLTTTANAVYQVMAGPPAVTEWGDPGAQVVHTLQVTNTGNITDTFDVAVSENAWPVAAAFTVGPVAAGGNANLNVTVTVPVAAMAGANDAARITLASRGNSARSAAAVLTTTANAAYQVAVGPAAVTGWGDPGTQVTYTLRVTNTGNIADTLDVGAVGNAWPLVSASTIGPLAAGGSVELNVVVTVPETAMAGATDEAEISVTSRGDPARRSTSALTTRANVVHHLAMEPMVAARMGERGTTVTYTLHLTNTGNAMDTFTLGCAGNNWNVQLSPPTSITLPAGAEGDVLAAVTIPPTATGVLSDTVLVQVTGMDILQLSSLTTRVVFHVYLPVTFRNP